MIIHHKEPARHAARCLRSYFDSFHGDHRVLFARLDALAEPEEDATKRALAQLSHEVDVLPRDVPHCKPSEIYCVVFLQKDFVVTRGSSARIGQQ